jgi:hypothetical protein
MVDPDLDKILGQIQAALADLRRVLWVIDADIQRLRKGEVP